MSYSVTIFGIDFVLKPVAFTLPIGKGWDIYWYGIIIATGFLLALIYALRNSKRFSIDNDRMLDAVLVTTPVAILCARAYYIIFDPDTTFADFFNFSGNAGFSGLAIYGGVIGAFACGFLMCKLRKINIADMFDLAATCFLIGQGVGRWGNFINQEAYGTFTGSAWWGMQSERTIAEMGAEGLVHPCFLYESVWCIAGFFLLNHFSKKRRFSGQLVLMYGAWYGLGRGFIELLRTDSLMLGAFRVSSLLSFLLCAVCSILLVFFYKRSIARASESGYGDQFAEQLAAESEENGEIEEDSASEAEQEEATQENIIEETENESVD